MTPSTFRTLLFNLAIYGVILSYALIVWMLVWRSI